MRPPFEFLLESSDNLVEKLPPKSVRVIIRALYINLNSRLHGYIA
jgi:hypothetical protein